MNKEFFLILREGSTHIKARCAHFGEECRVRGLPMRYVNRISSLLNGLPLHEASLSPHTSNFRLDKNSCSHV